MFLWSTGCAPRLEQVADSALDRVGDPMNVVQADVTLAALDLADVAPVQSCDVSEGLLAQPPFAAQVANACAELLPPLMLEGGRFGHRNTLSPWRL